MQPRSWLQRALGVAVAATGLAACSGSGSDGAPSGAPAASTAPAAGSAPPGAGAGSSAEAEPRPAWIGIDRSRAEVEKVLNAAGREPYAGPVGTLRGRITIQGDPPPKVTHGYPEGCAEAAATYGTAFRVGQPATPGGAPTVADVLVAVTGYTAFVPPKEPVVQATIRGCAFDRRTYAATYGQRVEIRNLDPKNSYMPYLMGAPLRAYMVAMPQGNPVKLYPREPSASRYLIRDEMARPFLVGELFVLKYATHAVTGLDGLYEITGIPVGKVRVDAFLPAIDKSDGKDVEIAAGINELDLELRFDAKTDRVVELPLDRLLPQVAQPSASAGAPAPPVAPSASSTAAPR